MEQGKNNILRHAYSYIGQDLDKRDRFLVLYTGTKVNGDDERAIIRTSMEAMADGWRIIVNGFWKTVDIVTREAWKMDQKVLNLRYDDVFDIPIGPMERGVFLTRGCVFSAPGMVRDRWWLNRRRGDELLSVIADCCIFVNDVPRRTLTDMLDRGVECAVLRPALRLDSAKEAALMGAPVIDSYYSWARDPKTICWIDDEGDPNLLNLRDF